MTEKIRRIFPGNNSTRGFYSYYAQCLKGMEQIYILKGGPGTGKSSLMKGLGKRFQREGFVTEHWLCSSDPASLDGLILPKEKIAVVDGTAPHIVEPRYPGAVETLIPLGECWEDTLLKKAKARIILLTDRISAAFAEAYRHTAEIGKIGELLTVLETENEAETFPFSAPLPKISGGKAELKPFFAMAMTPLGVMDLREELWQRYNNRFFLLGSDPTGRSRLLKALAAAAQRLQLCCEVGYGPFDPATPVAVFFPDFDLAVTAVDDLPESSRLAEDRVLCFEGKKTEAISALERKRQETVKKATAALAEAHRLHDELEAIYIDAMDFDKVAEKEKTIYQKIINSTAKG